MKKYFFGLILCLSFLIDSQASVPTEEGLLKNLNNSELPGPFITLKMMSSPTLEPEKAEYIKLYIQSELSGPIAVTQSIYSNSQMLPSQLKSVKYFPDIVSYLRKEKQPERHIFNSLLVMLSTNRSLAFESFLEKNGVSIVKNKTLLNEDKIRLLRQYRAHLINSKGRGDAGSPLNPEDPKAKERVLDLFRANSFKRARNIELTKKDGEFLWKVDWKVAQAYFTNEERRFRLIEYSTTDSSIKLEASQYLMFNGINELPKFFNLVDSSGINYKIQTLGMEVKKIDKKPAEYFEEYKKLPNLSEVNLSFLL